MWTQKSAKSGIEATHSNDLGSDGVTADGALKIVVTVPQSGQAGHTKLEYKSSVFCSTFNADTSVFNTLNLNYPHKITFDVKADVAGEFKVQLISSDAGTEPAAKQSLLRSATTSWTTESITYSQIDFSSQSLTSTQFYLIVQMGKWQSGASSGDALYFDNFQLEYLGASTLGVNEFSSGAYVSLYPNPVASSLNISTAEELAAVHIYNVAGQLVKSAQGNVEHVAVSDLLSGIYFVKLTNQSGEGCHFKIC